MNKNDIPVFEPEELQLASDVARAMYAAVKEVKKELERWEIGEGPQTEKAQAIALTQTILSTIAETLLGDGEFLVYLMYAEIVARDNNAAIQEREDERE